MQIPVSHLSSQIDKQTIQTKSENTTVLQDYFTVKDTVDEANSKATKTSNAKSRNSGKKKKHVVDKVGPFAQKGREESNLVMCGKDGFGIFAKKTEKTKINENKGFNDTDQVLQMAISHPKSAMSNPQNFGKKPVTKDKAKSAMANSRKASLKTESDVLTTKVTSETTINTNIMTGKDKSPKNYSKFPENLLINANKISAITEENSISGFSTDNKTYYTKELDDKIDKDISLQLSNLYDKTYSETESIRHERESEDALYLQRQKEHKKLSKELALLNKHIERESQLRKVFESELGKQKTTINQTKQKNEHMYDRIDEKKNYYEHNDTEKAKKWQLKKDEVFDKKSALDKWTQIVEELEEKNEDILSKLQVKFLF